MKKKKPNQQTGPELNKKQKEQLQTILEEEKNIRDHLKSVRITHFVFSIKVYVSWISTKARSD